MEETVGSAIELLAGQITKDTSSSDALRFTQAALNLAHVAAIGLGMTCREARELVPELPKK